MAFDALKKPQFVTTDRNGHFRIDHLFPDQEFKLRFTQGAKQIGPEDDKAPKYKIAKHGDTLPLGDVKLELNTRGQEGE